MRIWYSLKLINCTFVGNSSGSVGGGVNQHVREPSLVTNCTFIGNSAAYGGGALSFTGPPNDTPVVANCTFSGNVAESGGAIWVWNHPAGLATITNSTFSANEAEEGAGMFVRGTAKVSNCILWDSGDDEIAQHEDGFAIVRYSNVRGGWGGAGGNNIDADPLFVDPDGPKPNLALLPESACIDAGLNNALPPDIGDLDADGDTDELVPLDLEGNPRFVDVPDTDNTGCGLPVVVDMGAYEFQKGTPAWPILGDLDGDLRVGLEDLGALVMSWGSCDGCCLADLDIDGTVGIADLLILFANWGPSP